MDSSKTQHQSNDDMNQLKGSADSCAKQLLPPMSEEIYYSYHYMMVEFYEQTGNFDQLLLLRVTHSKNIESLRDREKASELLEKIDDVIEILKSRQSAIKKPASTMKQKREGEDKGLELAGEDMDALIMCFKGDREKALMFLKQISDLKDSKKTTLVNRLVKSGDISKEYRHRQLWSVLRKNGLYSKSESNWYKTVL